MQLKLYQIDAFASKLFEGNPAAVCPLNEWLPETTMQSIATENNLSETAFFVPQEDRFAIRWFTPDGEVDLCGHATLASAYVLFNLLGYDEEEIEFDSKSGILAVSRENEWLKLDFPCQPPMPCEAPAELLAAFDQTPMECLKGEDWMVVFADESAIEAAEPDFAKLRELDLRGVIITAKSSRYDFVARFFAPKYGIDEDPVTGSAYTQLAPYWASKINKTRFHAKQLSKRGGELICELAGDRVFIYGQAVPYLEGTIQMAS